MEKQDEILRKEKEFADKLIMTALQESEKKYRALFEGSVEGVIIVNSETKKLITANPAMCKMLGYTQKELLQLSVKDIHPGESLDFVISEFTAQTKKEKSLASNIPCLRKDGTIFYADFNSTLIELDGQKCNVGFVTDISERKQAEKKEKRLKNDLELLNKFTVRLAGLSNEENIYQYLADRLYEITGSIVGLSDFNQATEETSITAFAGIDKTANHILKILGRHPVGMSFSADAESKRRIESGKMATYQGGLYELALRTVPKIVCRQLEKLFNLKQIYLIGFIRDSDILGSATFLSSTYFDLEKQKLIETLVYQFSIVLHRRLVEVDLLLAKEKAEQADILKSSFLANMSHEIRTPMNAIVGFADLLTDPDITEEEKKDFAKNIKSSAKVLLNLINDIIDLAKIESGHVSFSESECDVHLLLLECYTAFKEIKKEKGKNNIELYLKNKIGGKNLLILTDPFKLRQILTNLLDNAVKYTETGYIEFGYKINKQNFIQFYIKDTGIGITEKQQKIIFNRFRQVEDEHTRKYSGAGLGLAICKSIVTHLGGEIWVESMPGEGSIFYFTVPNTPAESAAYDKTEEKPSDIDYNWKGKNILVAEDEQLNYEYIEKVLSNTNAVIYHALNGKEAVAFCKTEKVDLILMDIKMPVMDGYEAIKKIRAFNKDIPIIAVTAYAVKGEKEKCMEAGSNDYLSKPVRKETLLKTISKYIICQ